MFQNFIKIKKTRRIKDRVKFMIGQPPSIKWKLIRANGLFNLLRKGPSESKPSKS